MKLDPEEASRLAASLDSEVEWSPEHFPLGGIHWYAAKGTDNKKHEHVSPTNALARDAIMAARPDVVGPGGLFPAPTDASKPIGYHVLKRWFEKAEKQAELPHLKGGLWQPFRRGWATARKHLPTEDVAKDGGWRDEATMQRCYVRADDETILSAVNAG